MIDVSWWTNVIGIIFSGTGASILAYDVFSFTSNYSPGTWGHPLEEGEHKKKNQNLIKFALILIPVGAAFQLLSILLGRYDIMEIIKALELFGLIFSIIGTGLMIHGGLDAFIKIVTKEEKSKKENGIIDSSYGNGIITLDFKEPNNPKRLLKENKWGMILLAVGFSFQLIAVALDLCQCW